MTVQCAADEIVGLIRPTFQNASCTDHHAGCEDYIELAEKARQALRWDEAIALCERASPPCGQTDQNAEYCRCVAQTYVGVVYQSQGNLVRAEERYQQCATDFSGIHHPDAKWNEAICRYALGLIRLAQGDLDEAQKAFQQSRRSAAGQTALEKRIHDRLDRVRILRYQRERRERETKSVPVIGISAAGEPMLAVEIDQGSFSQRLILSGRTCSITRCFGTSPDPTRLLQEKDLFALAIKGDSMLEVGINDGDYVIFKHQRDANPHDIVVVRIDYPDGAYSTVKRYVPQGDTIQLRAENPNFNPQVMIFSKNDATVEILGKALAVATAS